MKKILVLTLTLFMLTACSKNEKSNVNEATSPDPSTVITTSSSTVETNSSDEHSHKETQDSFPYAINLEDFVQKIIPNGNKEAQKMYYKLRFTTVQETVHPDIVVNVKELNNFGKSVYISTEDSQQIYYPVTISSVPTKTITVIGNSENSRKVEVNTQVKIEMPEDQSDPLQIVGDAYYLFYNQQDTISLAARNFNKNPGSEDLDSNMLEYIQQVNPQNTEDSKEEETETTDQNPNAIDTTDLTTEQVEDWTYYHEKLYWKENGQDLTRGDINYTFEKESNQTLKISLVTKWQPLGIYTIDGEGKLYREDPRSGETTFVTDEFDVN